MAYFALEPFGDEWLRDASLMAIQANASRDPKMKPEPFKPEDFMPKFEAAPEEIQPSVDGWRKTKQRFMALMKR